MKVLKNIHGIQFTKINICPSPVRANGFVKCKIGSTLFLHFKRNRRRTTENQRPITAVLCLPKGIRPS